MKVYHASKLSNLCELGISKNKCTTCSVYKRSKHVYVGTLDYIKGQYLKYCPRGLYYIYELEVDLSNFEELTAKGQWRTTETLFPVRILESVNLDCPIV